MSRGLLAAGFVVVFASVGASDPASVPATPVATRGDIVFVSGRDGARSLYVMNADGKNVRRLLAARGGDAAADPAWSPDRSRIAFFRDTPSGQGLHVVGADGTGLTRLEIRGAYVPNVEDLGQHPAWSPDGRRIAHAYGEGGIAISDVKGGRSRIVFAQRANLGGGFHAPAWSPDGTRIAAWSICCDPPSLVVERLPLGPSQGVASVPFPPDPRWEFAIDWSPDGRWLAVTLANGIWKVSASGASARRLRAGSDPAWSPDGRRIAFVSTRDGDAEIYVMWADGSGVRRLTNNARDDISPDW